MTEDDRKAILGFFERLRAAPAEVEPEADRLIAEQVRLQPGTIYTLTQMAFVQEHALAEAQNRIRQLEYETRQKQGGFLGGLLGGRGGPPPMPIHAPGYRPGMFENRSGFLGTAASTVMGVVGGIMLGQMLGSLFSPASAAEQSGPWGSSSSEQPSGPWGNPDDGRDEVGSGGDSGSSDSGGGDSGGDS